MLAGLVEQHFTCCSVHNEDSTVQGGVLGEARKHNANPYGLLSLSDLRPPRRSLVKDWSSHPSPPCLSDSLSQKDYHRKIPEGDRCTQPAHKPKLLNLKRL